MKILMVCLGNICRSPIAEGILKHKLQQRGVTDWFVDSAGTGDWHAGEAPDSRSIAKAKEYGIDISHQKARQITTFDLINFNLILTMDLANQNGVLSLAQSPAQANKVKLIRSFVNGESEDIPDPYYDNRFEQVYQMLNEACDKVVDTYCKN